MFRPGKAQPLPGKTSLLFILIFCHANADFQHRIIFFLGHCPDHAGKFNLVTDHRRGA
uniref:hypothetical protein n=1 Tax=Citrobacter freundii TaxID=546 RepID=UPI003D65E5C4